MQLRLMQGVSSNANGIICFLMIFLHKASFASFVPARYWEYDIDLFLMIIPHMSLYCKPVPVQYGENE